MRLSMRVAPILLLPLFAACGGDSPTVCCTNGGSGVRVVNAFTTSVDVLIDGDVAIAGLAPGAIDTTAPAVGGHTISIRPTSGAASAAQSITTSAGGLNTFAAVRSSTGAVSSVALDDTNAVVPAGATKVRVIHFAPNAGELQVYRTQPDFGTPIRWQFPFTYQAEPTSLSAPFVQSTVGGWEVRIWQTPADATGWLSAPVKIVLLLASGEKKTVLILDKEGGGVRVEVL
jgi:hypothetical protein